MRGSYLGGGVEEGRRGVGGKAAVRMEEMRYGNAS